MDVVRIGSGNDDDGIGIVVTTIRRCDGIGLDTVALLLTPFLLPSTSKLCFIISDIISNRIWAPMGASLNCC